VPHVDRRVLDRRARGGVHDHDLQVERCPVLAFGDVAPDLVEVEVVGTFGHPGVSTHAAVVDPVVPDAPPVALVVVLVPDDATGRT
jgi:hypothetical protein